MELGPIQKAWIQSLKDHPERQAKAILGVKTEDGYKACCLGELHIIACLMKEQIPEFKKQEAMVNNKEYLTISAGNFTVLSGIYTEYGLHDASGQLISPYTKENRSYQSLAQMNDGGLTWSEIAKFVEENTDLVFTKSV